MYWLKLQKPFWTLGESVDENYTYEVTYSTEGPCVFDTVMYHIISGLAASELLEPEIDMHDFKLV